MTTTEPVAPRLGWLERLAPLGGLIFGVWLLIGFFTSGDYGETPADVLAYAESEDANLIMMQILALATPLLIGWFLYGLLARLPTVDSALRTLAAIGGALFVAFLSTGLTLWSAPLLDDSLTEVSAETYLALDDAGWLLLGTAGVSVGVMIIAVSALVLRHRLLPAWAGWVSVALGVLSLATVAAVGFFAWIAWFILASGVMLLRDSRGVRRSEPAAA